MATSGSTRTTLISPFQYFADPTRARPIFNGFIFIGRVDGDPTNTADQIPVQVICECGGSPVNVTQPIRTGPGGLPIYNGSPAQIVVCRSNYSITLQDNNRVQVYHSPNVQSGFVNQPITHTTLAAAMADDNSSRQIIRLLERGGAEFRRAVDQTEFNSFPEPGRFTDAVGILWVYIVGDSINIVELGAIDDPSNTIDSQPAIQAAVDLSSRVEIPEGSFYISRPIRLPSNPNQTTFSNLQTGRIISGQSTLSIITRNEPDQTEGLNETEWAANSAFSVHGTYHTIENMTIHRSGIGVFFGQNPDEPSENTFCSRLTLDRLNINNCGTGILWGVAAGITYSLIDNCHMWQCQIGMKTTNGRWVGNFNCNRNKISNTRFSRCWIGLELTVADTNTFYSVDFEGFTATAAATSGKSNLPESYYPSNTPDHTEGVALLNRNNTFNRFFGSTFESCFTRIVENATGGQNQYYGCLIGERESSPERVNFADVPSVFITDRTFINQNSRYGTTTVPTLNVIGGRGFIDSRLISSDSLTLGSDTTGYGSTVTENEDSGAIPTSGVFSKILSNVGRRNTHQSAVFTTTFRNTSLNLGGTITFTVQIRGSNGSSSVLVARIDDVMLRAYGVGGSTIRLDDNTLLVASQSIVNGVLTVSVTNSGLGYGIDASSTRIKTTVSRVV